METETQTEAPAVVEKKQQGFSVDAVTMTQKTAIYPDEEQRGLVRWLYSYGRDNGWTSGDLARETTISWTTIYRIWIGDYRNPNTGELVDISNVCSKIEHYKKLAEARDLAQRLPFVETSVWHRVRKVCTEALEEQCFSFIYGESQIGKTAALKEYSRRNNHGQTVYVLVPASSGVQAVLQAIARSCHISTRTNFETLRERVLKYFDHTKLLILDEVHECFQSFHHSAMRKVMGLIRQLQETTGCGVVLCGTNAFRHELERGEFVQMLKQLRKRGIWELQLEDEPTSKDLRAIAAFYELGDASKETYTRKEVVDGKVQNRQAPVQDLVTQINLEYGLGKYTKFLGRASKLAASKSEKFAWHHFARIVEIAESIREKPSKERK